MNQLGRKNAYLAVAASILALATVTGALAEDASRKLAPVEHSQGSQDIQTVPDTGAAPDVQAAPDAGASSDAGAMSSAAATFKVTIPTVDAKDSSIDAATLKKILAGDFLAHAKDLAKLNATSITIPEIDVSFVPGGSSAAPINYVYKDVEIDGVHNGVADSASVGSMEGSQTGTVSYKFGKASVQSFDIGGSLALYGFIPSPDQTMKTMYKNADLAGGTLSGPNFNCEIGSFHTDEFKARPLKLSFTDLLKLVTSDQFKQKEPSPEAIGKLFSFYADMFTAFESSPVVLQKLACSGKDDKGEDVAVSMGPMTIGGFGHAQYPAIEAKNVSIDSGASGKLSLGDVTMKKMDLTSVIAAIQSAPAAPSQDWFTANARRLIPAFEGFAFSDLKLDVPDTNDPGQRIKATVADFDLSLGDYFAGIPTKISTSMNHLIMNIPPAAADAGADDSVKTLRDVGIKTLDLGFDFAIHRDAAAKTIVIDKAESRGDNLGSFNFAGLIGNVDDSLFTADQNTILPLAMALTVKSIKVDATDAGFTDLILQKVAKDQGTNVAAVRAAVSGGAQGQILGLLGDTPSGKAVGDAVAKFIAGAKSISITATAKDPGGLTAVDLAAAQADPTALTSKVTIDASAQ